MVFPLTIEDFASHEAWFARFRDNLLKKNLMNNVKIKKNLLAQS